MIKPLNSERMLIVSDRDNFGDDRVTVYIEDEDGRAKLACRAVATNGATEDSLHAVRETAHAIAEAFQIPLTTTYDRGGLFGPESKVVRE